jgi:hypothetical protein
MCRAISLDLNRQTFSWSSPDMADPRLEETVTPDQAPPEETVATDGAPLEETEVEDGEPETTAEEQNTVSSNDTEPQQAHTSDTNREPWSYPRPVDGHMWSHTIDQRQHIMNTMNGKLYDDTKTPTECLTAAFGSFDDKLESDLALFRYWVRYVFPGKWPAGPKHERWETERPRLENELLQSQTILLYFQWRITPSLCKQEYVLRHIALKHLIRFAYVSFAPVVQRFMWDPSPNSIPDFQMQRLQKFRLLKFHRLVCVTGMEIDAEIFYRHVEWDTIDAEVQAG